MRKCILRHNAERWCELQVELEHGRLSICGAEGRIVTHAAAKKLALDYWESYFHDNPQDRLKLSEQRGRLLRTTRMAARYVLNVDGELHGLDVHKEDGKYIYLTESCGQITGHLREWFPEVVPYLKWHLNDMHAECEHQEARGENWSTHPDVVCPECGHKLGSSWLKRALPLAVVEWVMGMEHKP